MTARRNNANANANNANANNANANNANANNANANNANVDNEENINENANNVNVDNTDNEENINDTSFDASDYKKVVKHLLSVGCKKIQSIKIKNVNYTEKDEYTMVSFTLNKAIRGYVSHDNGGTYEEGMTNTLFTSLYAITGAMKEDEDLGWMANTLLENPSALNVVLNGAEITIVQQEISAGEEFTNPFSTRTDVEPQVYDHDLIINHVISFKLSKMGSKAADRLMDKLLGF